MKKTPFAVIIAAGLSTLSACGVEGPPLGSAEEQFHSTLEGFEAFEARTWREPRTGRYIVDGDMPIATREELRKFYEKHVRGGALIIHQEDMVDERWSDAQKLKLTYCVSTDFGPHYDLVVGAMAAAAADWESAAGINFRHLPSEDGACGANNPNVIFDVSPMSDGPYLALAFYPSDPREWRNILVHSSSFQDLWPYTLTGIMRHELGHALGFRHEHTHLEADPEADCFENFSWRALTPYDSASVMHYPQCKGSNRGDLVLTAYDQQGVASVYGPSSIDAFTVTTPNDADRLKGDETNLIPGDFNGDGRMDFLRQEKNNWDNNALATAEVWLSNGNGTFTVTTPNGADRLKGDETNLIPGDFNGDGRMDLLRQEKNNWDNDALATAEVWLSNGNGTFSSVEPSGAEWLKGDETNLIPGDFNGDGRMDFLRQEKNAWDDDAVNTAQVWLSHGDGTFSVLNPNEADWLKGDETNLLPGDFNGDGLTDVLRQEKNAWDNVLDTTAQVWLSQGDGTFISVQPHHTEALNWGETKLIPGDYNGDGRMDLLRQEKNAWDDESVNTAQVWLSTL